MENEPYLPGHFLISGPHLFDPNFFRTVVLMVQHNKEGAFGLVVNRPAEHTLGSILPGFAGGEAQGIPVYIGGPVQQDFLFALHSGFPGQGEGERGAWAGGTQQLRDSAYRQSPAAVQPVQGVIFEPATQDLIRYLAEEWDTTPAAYRPRVRLYAGYSGWAANQLERELREYAWFTHTADADIVFHPEPESAWKIALSAKGNYYKFVAETGYIPSIN